MKYRREVVELLRGYPGRRFKMDTIIRYVRSGRNETQQTPQQRQATRLAVFRVLRYLEECSSLDVDRKSRTFATYAWPQTATQTEQEEWRGIY